MSYLAPVSSKVETAIVQQPRTRGLPILAPARLVFQKLRQTIARHCQDSFDKLVNVKLIRGPSKRCVEAIQNFVKTLLSSIKSTSKHVENFLTKNRKRLKRFRLSTMLTAVGVPLTIHGIVKDGKGTHKIQTSLSLISNIVVLSSGVWEFTEALAEVGTIAGSTTSWTIPMMGVSAVLSLGVLVANSVQLHQTRKISRELRTLLAIHRGRGESSTEGYEKAIKLLTGKKESYLKKHFRLGGGKLKKELERVSNKAGKKLHPPDGKLMPKDVAEARGLLKDTVGAFQDRIKKNMWSSALLVMAALVSTVGAAVFLFSPIAWVGYTQLALGSGIVFGRLIFDYLSLKKFKNDLGFAKKPKKLKSNKQPETKPISKA